MKKIITSLLLGMALLAMVISCTNNASETETSYALIAVFENTGNPDITMRVKAYENNTWEVEAERTATGQKIVGMKGTHTIDLTTDGDYTIIYTHLRDTMMDNTFEIDDESTWGSLIPIPDGTITLSVELKDNGRTLVIDPSGTSPTEYTLK